MPKLTDLQELESAIRVAANETNPGETTRTAAERFYGDHRELIAHVADEWIL